MTESIQSFADPSIGRRIVIMRMILFSPRIESPSHRPERISISMQYKGRSVISNPAVVGRNIVNRYVRDVFESFSRSLQGLWWTTAYVDMFDFR